MLKYGHREESSAIRILWLVIIASGCPSKHLCFNGAVKYVQLPTNRETGRVRGFGFVEMETSTEEDAQINAILVKKNR